MQQSNSSEITSTTASTLGSPRKSIHFVCVAPSATRVSVTGAFNGWNQDAHPMRRQADGSWVLEVTLPAGHHEYRFVVDGMPTLDPRARGATRDENGRRASLLAVA
jgi:1,4-alpha-glucan branching enzyme